MRGLQAMQARGVVMCLVLCLTMSKLVVPRLKRGKIHHAKKHDKDMGYAATHDKGGVANGGLGRLEKDEGGITEHPQHADTSVKYLWTQAPAFMGFGDKVRWHYVQLNIASALNRTWIAPPFHFTQAVPKKVKNKETTKLVATDEQKARSELSKAYEPGYTPDRFYAISEWFDKKMLANMGPVIEFADWYDSKIVPGGGGHVDVAVVPGDDWQVQREETEDWASLCQKDKANDGSSRAVFRFDRSHHFHRIHCLDTSGVVDKPTGESAQDDIEVMQVNGIEREKLVQLLTRGGLADAVVLGLDGFKNAATFLQIDDTLTGQSYYSLKNVENSETPRIRRFWDLRRCFRWNDALKLEGRQFIQDQNGGELAPYAALHWRHGDKLVFNIGDKTRIINQTPDGMAARVKKALSKYPKKVVASLKLLFLATANFYQDDLKRFADVIHAELGLKVVQFPGTLPLKAVAMDMVLASGATVFFGDDQTSMFTSFIRDERRLQGMEKDEAEYLLQWI